MWIVARLSAHDQCGQNSLILCLQKTIINLQVETGGAGQPTSNQKRFSSGRQKVLTYSFGVTDDLGRVSRLYGSICIKP